VRIAVLGFGGHPRETSNGLLVLANPRAVDADTAFLFLDRVDSLTGDLFRRQRYGPPVSEAGEPPSA
jgi:hypothetical protein